MNINKQELKKIIYDFNRISNRLLRVDFTDYSLVLKKFLNYIESTELIWAVIIDAGKPSYDVAKEVQKISGYSNKLLNLGDTEREEITNIYYVLKYCSDNTIDIPYELTFAYSSSTKWQDKTREFNTRVVLVLINNIEAYLTKVGIDMGLDENTKYSITVNNGQVNLASDSAKINATQNNGVDIKKIESLITNIISNIDVATSLEDRQQIEESLEMIQTELTSPKPKKSMINMALEGLKMIESGTEFSAAVVKLVKFVQTVM
ncbi:hypothetical protein [Pediococcus pentosaceus]|uniref:hypothetical protein n=1 Tax=Pediococcus pentosaceus TaxID=1255 RepID=UPI00132F7ACF|nr:hypothetical protein [Pediococcus pentosaceus]KAF0506975.1 hypothetical protein GBP24_03335 [Pediococcus pentosaceus]